MNVEIAIRSVKLFVSSPVDVAPERGRVQAVAAKLNRDYDGIVRFDTVLWEEHFYKADRSFQPQIKKPDACDILISIFWTRVGTELPADFARMPNGKPYPSGTAYELLTALEASKAKGLPDVYVFRKTADAALPTADPDRRRQAQVQLDALEAFWNEWFKSEQGHFKAAFQTFANTDEFERQIEELLRQWLHAQHLLGPRLKWPKEKGSPFTGLAAFEADQAAVFFGRDRAVDKARRRLVAAAERGTPFLLIVGASGSGKSSLARAGLIPRMTTPGVAAAIDLWRTAILKPGEGQAGPVAALAAALFAALPELAEGDFPTAAALADNLQRGGTAAARPVAGALTRIAVAEQRERHAEAPLRPALLLLVDQLDELFAQAVGDHERRAFAEAITQLVANGRVWCITTLRADLYELMLKQPGLNALKEAGASLDLGPPGPAELAEIVRAPAAAAGLAFETTSDKGALDDRLLADAKTADSLPLLQFTLRQLYERRVATESETLLTYAAYEALGGLQGAIAAEAERAVANLPAGALDALPKLLRQLAEPARHGTALTLREALHSEAAADPREAALVEALLGARILVARQDMSGRPTLRLAHDAVLTSWPKAAAAAQASRDFYRVRAEVEDAEHRWREHGQPKDRLIQRGVPLAEAEKLIADFAGELPDALVGYVNASRNQARLRQRLVAAAAVFFFVLAVVATGAGIVAYREQQQALRNFALAKQTADSLVVDIAQGLREVEGLRAETVRKILGAAEATFNQISLSDPNDLSLLASRTTMLDTFGDTYLALNDLESALKAYRESLAISERLAKAKPKNLLWQRGLATAQEKVGYVLRAQGHLAEALQIYRQDLATMEGVVKAAPDNPQWQRDLSISHEVIAGVLLDQGKLPDALQAYRDSLAIAEHLAQSDPGNADWQRDLATLKAEIADVFEAQGHLPEALQSLRDSVAIMERFVKAQPDNTGAQRNLAVAYNRLGDVLKKQGHLADALTFYRNGLAVTQRLAKTDPDNAKWQADLRFGFSKIGEVLMEQGNLAEALQTYRDSLTIAARLAKADPTNTDRQRDLSIVYEDIGDVLRAQGHLTEALQSYRDGHAIRERLAATDPSNAGWQRDLSVSTGRIADTLLLQGDLPGALQGYRNQLAIALHLAQTDPSNASWQRDIAFSYNRVGSLLAAQRNFDEALQTYREGLAIVEHLTKTDPANAGWQLDLAVTDSLIADALRAQGQLAGALKSYRDSLAIAKRLAKIDPTNAIWQRNLAATYEKVGDVLTALQNPKDALASYRAEVAVREAIAKSNPGDAEGQRALSVSYNKAGSAALAQGDAAQALDDFRNGLGVIEALAKTNPANAGWQRDVAVSYNLVGTALLLQHALPEALKSYRAALAIAERLANSDRSNTQWQNDLQFCIGRIGLVAWNAVLARNFALAMDATDQAVALAPQATWLYASRADTLMFLGRVDEARALFLKYRGAKNVMAGKSWEAIILEGFAALRKAGLTAPLMDEIERQFSSAG